MVNIVDGIRRMARVMSGKDPNPTGVTAAQLGTYTKQEVEGRLNNLVSAVDMRLSQYGDTSFLPVNVSGSFEGSATGYKSAAIFRETDGRVYILRNGTDGRTDGAYFAEVEMTVDGAAASIKATSIPYRPPFIPEGWHVTEVSGGYKDQIYGRIQNLAGAYKVFIAYTGYTMNQDLHTGIIIEKFSYLTDIYTWEEGGTVFISQLDISNGMGLVIRKVYTSDLSAEPVLITGWSGTGIESKEWTDQGFIRLSDVMQRMDTDVGINAYSVNTAGVNGFGVTQTWPQVEIYHLGGARFRAIYGHESWVSHVNGTDDRKFSVRQIDFNVELATYELANEFRSPIIAHLNDEGRIGLTSTDRSQMPRAQFDGGWDGNLPTWTVITPDGLWMAYRRGAANSVQVYIEYKKDPSTVNDLFKRNCVQIHGPKDVGHQFGTVMQAPLFTPNIYDQNSMMVTTNNNTHMRSNMGGWIPTDDFRLPDGTMLKSTPLNSDRANVPLDHWPCEQVTEIVGDVVQQHRAIFWNGRYKGWSRLNNATEQGTEDIVLPEEIFTDIQNRAVEIARNNGFPLVWFITQVVVPQWSRLPPFATTFFLAPNQAIMQVRQSLDFGGVKTGFLPTPTTTWSSWEMCRTGGVSISVEVFSGLHGIHIADYDDFSVQGGVGAMYATWVGNGGGIGSFWKYKDGAWTITYRETSQRHATDAGFALPIPYTGVVLFGNRIDFQSYNCNLTGIVIGKDEADIDDMENRRWNTPSVFFTTAVVNGWVVYFSEETPVTIGNVSGHTVIQNIDLEAVFGTAPANKTFLVYVRLENGTFGHSIVEKPVDDPNYLFIGYVYTNNDGIRTIEVDKVIGINGYAISGTKRGSAIAVTDGNPNGEGTFKWK